MDPLIVAEMQQQLAVANAAASEMAQQVNALHQVS